MDLSKISTEELVAELESREGVTISLDYLMDLVTNIAHQNGIKEFKINFKSNKHLTLIPEKA